MKTIKITDPKDLRPTVHFTMQETTMGDTSDPPWQVAVCDEHGTPKFFLGSCLTFNGAHSVLSEAMSHFAELGIKTKLVASE